MDHRVLPFDVTGRVTRGVRGKDFTFEESERDIKMILHHNMCIAPTIGGACTRPVRIYLEKTFIGKVRKVLELNRPIGRSFAVV
jgi:hypothetical protein